MPASTRPAAARLPALSWRQPSSSTRTEYRTASTIPKRLTAIQREALFPIILRSALGVSIASVCAEGIDRSDIRKASLEAMRRALAGLPVQARLALADGRDIPPGMLCECRALIRGDQRSQSIAAASIVAKTMRDRMMQRCGQADPRYGLDSHMGYATERHRAAIEIHGPALRLHRLSFSPFRMRLLET